MSQGGDARGDRPDCSETEGIDGQAAESCQDLGAKPFQATHLLFTSLRTTPDALLQLVRGRWSIEGCHWIRDTQLHEDAHRYRGNGAGVLSTLRTAALNLLRLPGFRTIRAGLPAVMHDITALLAMAGRRPEPTPRWIFVSSLPWTDTRGPR